MVEQIFLPLGSVVSVRGNDKKLMIISRALVITQNDEQRFYDYGGCLYPEGIVSDQAIYFNNDVVEKVVWRGFEDPDEQKMQSVLSEALAMIDIEKGNPEPLGSK